MQLTTITAILVAAVSASATPLNARQASRSVTGTLYNNNLVWHGDSVGTSTFVQCVPGGFHDLTVQVPGAITDTDFSNDTLKRTIRLYAIPCNQVGTGVQYHEFEVGPRAPGYVPPPYKPEDCRSQNIKSYVTL